ncbi:MAG: LAGLIDADG family homing endonuclease, partial [Aggregatilineales bacterium]
MAQPEKTERNALHDLGYKIFLDRYARKDMTRETLEVGDTVIVVVNPQTGQREIGTVTALNLPEVTINLRDGETVSRDIEHVDKPLETRPEEMMARVARGVAETEKTPDLQKAWSENFRWLLDDWKFVPGGRILAAAGTNQDLTYYNCYVVPAPHDSREGIMNTLTQMTEIMSRGGGVGINISTLRPRHAYVKGVNGRSSGSVSWGALYSFVTGLIEQGGCFGANERIATDKGLIPAQELVERIELGEAFQAMTHKGLRPIVDKFRNGIKPLFEVTTSRGYTVKITADHKVAILMDGEIVTMPLKYLQIGDEILILDTVKEAMPVSANSNMTDNKNHPEVEPDTIASITPIGEQEVFDFEVEDVHLLSANGVYTSNSRRGALMLILNDWHPDVFDFINSKREAGKITNANISVGVSDKLMDAVKADGDWELRFPDTGDPDYDDLWDGDLDTWQAAGRRVITYKTIKARELWRAIIESAWASAEPGVWFNERSNKMANSWYFNPLIATNPCVTGDSRLYTDKGLVTMEELFEEETEISVTIDGRFGVEATTLPASRVFYTGDKPVFRVQSEEGYYLRATAEHRVMTPRGWVEVQDLEPGDHIHILNRKGAFGQEGSLEEGRTLGWLIGDGTIKSDRAVLSFFGDEKQELAPMFAGYVNEIVADTGVNTNRTYTVGVVDVTGRDEARVQSDRLRTIVEGYGLVEKKHQVPEVVFKGTEDMQRGFLQGLFTADGSVQYFAEKRVVSIRLASNYNDMLEQVQMLLANFGIACRIYQERRKAGYRKLPDGKGGLKEYWCEAQHELVISRANMTVFRDEVGFVLTRKQQQLEDMLADYAKGPRKEKFTARVKSITDEGVETVYDLQEPITHSITINGCIIHNCGEQPLGGFSVCNLGAVNLSKFYDAEAHDVAWDDLRQAVQYATRFLDNVIDTTPYFFLENETVQMEERRVGLGTMGIAELMVRCEIRYGSDESVKFIDKVYELIATTAYETSAELAVEKGAFPSFDAEKFLESGYMQQMPTRVRESIAEKGIRNVTLLTQAPTGCVAPDTLVSTATGLSPIVNLGDPQGAQWQITPRDVHTDEGLRKSSHFYINGRKTVQKVTTARGYSITATNNHRLRVLDENGAYIWRRMDELSINDRVVLKRGTLDGETIVKLRSVEQASNAKSELPAIMTPDFAELLGLYMGDGYTKKRGGLHIVAGQKDPDLLETVKNLMQRVWGERYIGVEERIGCWTANLTGYYIRRFFEANNMSKPTGNEGEGAAGAFIPDKVLAAGRECVAAFLRGLFEADGCISRGTVTLVSTSDKLIHQVQVALLGLGIVSTVRTMPEQENRFGTRSLYELRLLNRREAQRFVEVVGFLSDRKKALLAEIGSMSDRGDNIDGQPLLQDFYAESQGLKNEVRQTIIGRVSNGAMTQQFVRTMVAENPMLADSKLATLVDMDVFVDTVASIEEGVCDTYDISVPDNKTYIANGFISHNTTGTMVNTSTGVEPFFSWVYYRKSRLGLHEEQAPIAAEWFADNPGETELPDFFATAMDLDPLEHVKVQGAFQRWVDSAISKTANVPNEYTVDQVSDLYLYMYDLGCKGGTIYRDGSRDEQVLMLKGDERAESEMEDLEKSKQVEKVEAVPVPVKAEVVEVSTTTPHRVYPRPDILNGTTARFNTPFGKSYITMNSDEYNNPFEIFITVGKAGSDVQADAEALGRLISLQLRTTAPHNRREML